VNKSVERITARGWISVGKEKREAERDTVTYFYFIVDSNITESFFSFPFLSTLPNLLNTLCLQMHPYKLTG
jgi:hypothetical protein